GSTRLPLEYSGEYPHLSRGRPGFDSHHITEKENVVHPGPPTHNSGTQALTHLKLTNDTPLGPSGRSLFKKNHFRVSVTTTSCGRTKANLVPLDAEWPIIPTHNSVSSRKDIPIYLYST